MPKKRRPNQGSAPARKQATLDIVGKAIEKIALREGTTVENVRKNIQVAMIAGLMNNDPAVQAEWKRIPCAGELPTPEEVIAFCAGGLTVQ